MASERSHGMVWPPVALKSRSACSPGLLVNKPSLFFRGGKALDAAGPLVYPAAVKRSAAESWAR